MLSQPPGSGMVPPYSLVWLPPGQPPGKGGVGKGAAAGSQASAFTSLLSHCPTGCPLTSVRASLSLPPPLPASQGAWDVRSGEASQRVGLPLPLGEHYLCSLCVPEGDTRTPEDQCGGSGRTVLSLHWEGHPCPLTELAGEPERVPSEAQRGLMLGRAPNLTAATPRNQPWPLQYSEKIN